MLLIFSLDKNIFSLFFSFYKRSEMDSEKVDIIIFGATGFTGKYVVQEFVNINDNKYTWAIAGRNAQKLREVLDWVSARTGSKSFFSFFI